LKNHSPKNQRLVIIGNGMATTRLLEELSKRDHGYHIRVLGAEAKPYYNRLMLSPLLAGETNEQAITPYSAAWYQKNNVEVFLNHQVEQVDLNTRVISCTNGSHFTYDKLVWATGSKPFLPAIPGIELTGVMGFRDLHDIERMQHAIQHHQSAVVVGAGLLGIEAAAALAKQGMAVSLLHRNPVLMNRQIDSAASELLKSNLAGRHIQVLTGEEVASLSGEHRVKQVQLKSGKELDADLVIFATGILPNIELAANSNLITNRGIQVNAQMQTSNNAVYAFGECAEFEGNTYGLVAPIWQQAKVLADTLCDLDAAYVEQSYTTKLKVSGIDIHAFGKIQPDDSDQVLLFSDPQTSRYKKIILRNNQIQGALLFGDVKDSHWYEQLAQQTTDIAPFRALLMFGENHCQHLL